MAQGLVAQDRRLFGEDAAFADRTRARLAAIVDICSAWDDGTGMPQGYTYLGQFLAHEITSRELPREPTSERTRSLDLDSLYGPGARFDQQGRFLYCPGSAAYAKDLLRDPVTKAACIPDFRNDEHPILSQLHLTLQLFHNAVLARIQASEQGRQYDVARQFEHARRYVTASLQRVYVEDYLRQCSDQAVYQTLIQDGRKVIDIPPSERQLPFEITHAMLRFGHAQVRDRYLLNHGETETELQDLFSLSGLFGGPAFAGIPHDKVVDWRRFFPWGRGRESIKSVSGRRINPHVVATMGKLREPPVPDIVERNVDAGIRARLPSGQVVARRFAEMNIDVRISPQLRLQQCDERHRAALEQHGLWHETPLWLFMLIEAASAGGDGMRLGPLGSLFLCETIRSAVEQQENPTDVQAFCEATFGLERIGTFQHVARFTEPGIYDQPVP